MDLCEEGSGDYDQFESSGYEPDNPNRKFPKKICKF